MSRRWVVAVAAFGGLVLLGSRPLLAQRSILTLTGAPRTLTPTAADYANGAVLDAVGVAYTVDRQVGPPATVRTDRISIRSTSASLGGGKALSDLQWQRAGTGAWTPITTVDATVEQRQLARNSPQFPWTGSILFRMLLNWANDVPGTYAADLTVTLTVTTP